MQIHRCFIGLRARFGAEGTRYNFLAIGPYISVVYILRLNSTTPPPSDPKKTSPVRMFCNRSSQISARHGRKCNELRCKIYTFYDFFMLIIFLFLHLLLILYVHFSQFFSKHGIFPSIVKVGS